MTTHDHIKTAAARPGRSRALCATLALAGALAGAAGAARAQSPQGATPAASEIGHVTHTWLEWQASNRDAGPSQPMIGEAASIAYERYLDSFKTKIPAFYGSAASMSGGGGGTGSPLTPASPSQ